MDGGPNMQLESDPATGDLLYSYPDTATTTLETGGHFENISMKLAARTRDSMCDTLTELVTYDEDGRKEWAEIATDAYKLLGVGPESAADGAEEGEDSTADHPLLLNALTRFQSKAYAALLPSSERAVRTEPSINLDDIDDPDEREQAQQEAADAGARVERFYTYYLFERCDSYETETDQILHDCGMLGMGVRKLFMDKSRKNTPVRPMHVPLADIIISYDATSFRVGRITHRMSMPTSELVRMIKSGQYNPISTLMPDNDPKNGLTAEIDRIVGLGSGGFRSDETHKIYEVHCDLRLTEDPHPLGLARPYIVTVHATSREILSIVRNWEQDDPDEERIEHFIAYPFAPGKSATMPMGLGHILSNITRSLRDALRAGLDAGYYQNHPSGFKLSSFKLRDDTTRIRAGEFIDVDAPVDDINKAIMLHPFQGPSPGLQALAEKMEANGKELGGNVTIDFSQMMKAGIAAGPAMAAYEESAVFQTAIHRRLYKAMATELRMIHARMRQVHGNKAVAYGTNGTLRPGDLLLVNILPAMKPGEMSKQKSLLEAQAIWDMGKEMPDIIDRRKAGMELLRALGRPHIDDILLPDPEEEQPEPADPVTEYMTILQGKPVVAGLSQNHQAHIDSHAAQMKMLVGSSLPVEMGDAAMASLSAHIADHMAKEALIAVASAIGMDPAMMQEGIPPELEAQVAPMIALAIQQLEEQRRPPEQDDGKLAIAQLNAQAKVETETMKQRHEREMATMKHQQALQLQRQKDDAQMAREIEDNDAALEIAAMKGPASPSSASAGARISTGAGAGTTTKANAGAGVTP